MTRRIGILGGTFDPIHLGHLDLASAAQEVLALTEVMLIPSNVPPHRPAPAVSGFHRFAMVALAVAGRPGWRVSDLELGEPTRSYTSTTLRRLHQDGCQPEELFFLIGADAFSDITSWHEFPAILGDANFGVVSRPGTSARQLAETLPALASRMYRASDASHCPERGTWIFLIDAPTTDVSATAVRRHLALGQPIDVLVPPTVRQHIEQHDLYRPMASDRRSHDAPMNPAAGRLHGQS